MSPARTHALEIWTAGLDAVRAEPLVRRELVVEDDILWIDGHAFDRSDFQRVLVFGAGKAASAMAAGLVNKLDGWLPISGWVNVPEGTEREIHGIVTHPARPAGVNEPTADGEFGTREIVERVENAESSDLIIALISGGGSALLPMPIEGITLEEKLSVIRFLSGRGASIEQLNTVRKHISAIKGGGLLRRANGKHLVTLVLSDVLGDPLDLIASGPTVIDPSSPADALEVLSEFDPADSDGKRKLPDSIYRQLSQANACDADKEAAAVIDSTIVVVGNNAVAVDEAGIVAERLGYNHVMSSATCSEGLAEDVGRHLADMTVKMLRAGPENHRTDCLISGGEPVVQLAESSIRGKGGRNQQLVLAAYQRLIQCDLTDEEWRRVAILSGGTDGEDGPTDAAGAVLNEKVNREAVSLNLDVADHLRRNDAYTFFRRTGGLLMTGPTGTNVCDVRVALVTRPE